MRSLARVFTFTVISIIVTQKLLSGFSFDGNEVNTFILLAVALTLLNLLMFPVFKLIALPMRGVGFILLAFLLTLAILYMLTLFIPGFSVQAGSIGNWTIFGLVIPSRDFSVVWSSGLSALAFTLIYKFFNWL